MTGRLNVADRLAAMASAMPDALAVVSPWRHGRGRGPVTKTRAASGKSYTTITFAEIDRDATRLAQGLIELGVQPGMRLVLMVPPGIDFVALVFALLRAGGVAVLIDPGLGRSHLLDCLTQVAPDGFIAVSRAQAVRTLMGSRFPQARLNVTVGRRWFWGGPDLRQLRQMGSSGGQALPETKADDPAAIIFTSGSTGPPKGVLYTHQMLYTQVSEIRAAYEIQPGNVDMACFPLFGLFNSAMGVTTVLPEMNFSRPMSADPQELLCVAEDWQITQSFASPAVWNKLSRYCERHGRRIDTLRQVFSCGAPVPANVLQRTLKYVHADAQMHTPYGATECLPVSTIEAKEILHETSRATEEGSGICVGRPFETISWQVVRVSDEPLTSIEQATPVATGEIGELIVRGPQASPQYVTSKEANATSKIVDGDHFWHRMGDVGYLDEQGRFWYCGRKSHRVVTNQGTLYSIPVESILNRHSAVARSALVGVGPPGNKSPVGVLEVNDEASDQVDMIAQLKEATVADGMAAQIEDFLIHPSLPVDVRHNSKIDRQQLALWAEKQLGKRRC